MKKETGMSNTISVIIKLTFEIYGDGVADRLLEQPIGLLYSNLKCH